MKNHYLCIILPGLGDDVVTDSHDDVTESHEIEHVLYSKISNMQNLGLGDMKAINTHTKQKKLVLCSYVTGPAQKHAGQQSALQLFDHSARAVMNVSRHILQPQSHTVLACKLRLQFIRKNPNYAKTLRLVPHNDALMTYLGISFNSIVQVVSNHTASYMLVIRGT
jgi:hypothetical protein